MTAVALARSSARSRLTASVDLRGGGLRALTVDGEALVETYPDGSPPPYCAGAVLFPWPNRVRDGRWTQRGVEHQLAVDEPDLGHANHGLVRGMEFVVEDRGSDHVSVAALVAPSRGYPYAVGIRVMYRLTDHGLSVTSTVSNASPQPAPVALGAHPYLRIGDVPTRELEIRVRADRHLPLDDRLIPRAPVPVEGTPLDLRGGRMLGDQDLNACFALTGDAAAHGPACTVKAPDGRVLELWADDDFRYLQVYACPAYPLPHPDRRLALIDTRRALAVEPMTAPGDAFNSGAGLRWLAPAERWELSWGVIATWLSRVPG